MNNDNIVDVKYTEVNSESKKYFTLEEVCESLQVEMTTVVYWCNKFKEKLNIKSIGNFTIFTEIDLKNLKIIKQLIVTDKMDIKKAKEYLSTHTEILIKNKELQPTEESLLNVIAKIIGNQNEKINILANSQEQLININKQLLQKQDLFIDMMNKNYNEISIGLDNINESINDSINNVNSNIDEKEKIANQRLLDMKDLFDKHREEVKRERELQLQQQNKKGFFSWFKRG